MAFDTSQIKAARSRPEQTQFTSTDLTCVRELYLERRYKQCIQMCEDLLKPTLHPLHETFYLFHQAICYEALGLAAHNYSRNKIPFFDSAKEKFEAALDALPQPFANDEAGRSDATRQSPLVGIFQPSTSHKINSEDPSEAPQMPVTRVSSLTRTLSEASSHYSSSSSISYTDTVPDFDRYSPRPDLPMAPKSLPRTVTFPDVQKQEQKWDEAEQATSGDDLEATPSQTRQPSYQNRLSACLSSTHLLDEKLVPSPLFSRTKKTAHVPFPTISATLDPTAANVVGTLHISESPRPLLRTPKNHLTHRTLLPVRRTAVQTLISKYEKALPSPNSPCSETTSAPALTPPPHPTATPTTARFAAIASAFAPKKEFSSPPPVTPTTAKATSTIASYLTSHSLARYNTHLSSFATSLRASLFRTENMTEQAHEIQERHMLDKQGALVREAQEGGGLKKTRLASYWLLTPETPTTPRTPATPLPRITPLSARTPCKSASGSAFASAQLLPTLRSHLRRPKPEENNLKRRQRIEKLRACGFEVRKERYGWKGGRYYEEMRWRVEVELGV